MAKPRKLQKPYVKKIAQIGKFTVWRVDGKYIRDHIDIEFTNFGQHYRYLFIPQNEFWIDNINKQVEEKYYIDHMLVEHRLMKRGVDYISALARANKIQRRERFKHELTRMFRKIKDHSIIIEKVHKQYLKSYSSKNLSVWIVDGSLVRDLFFIDFTEGGHDKVYPFIPANEVWLDDDLVARERKFVLVHEMIERYHMAHGMTYDHAHTLAHELELHCRRNPKELDKKMSEVMKMNVALGKRK